MRSDGGHAVYVVGDIRVDMLSRDCTSRLGTWDTRGLELTCHPAFLQFCLIVASICRHRTCTHRSNHHVQ